MPDTCLPSPTPTRPYFWKNEKGRPNYKAKSISLGTKSVLSHTYDFTYCHKLLTDAPIFSNRGRETVAQTLFLESSENNLSLVRQLYGSCPFGRSVDCVVEFLEVMTKNNFRFRQSLIVSFVTCLTLSASIWKIVRALKR